MLQSRDSDVSKVFLVQKHHGSPKRAATRATFSTSEKGHAVTPDAARGTTMSEDGAGAKALLRLVQAALDTYKSDAPTAKEALLERISYYRGLEAQLAELKRHRLIHDESCPYARDVVGEEKPTVVYDKENRWSQSPFDANAICECGANPALRKP